MSKPTLAYDIIAVVIVAIWGMTFISSSKLLAYFDPAELFFIRFAIAYVGIVAMSHKKLFADKLRDELNLAVSGILGGSLYFWLENTALKISQQAGSISFIVCTAPLLTTILAMAVKKGSVKPGGQLFFGSFCALFGVGLIMFNGSFFEGAPLLGYILAAAAAITWAGYTLLVDGLSKRYDSVFITRKVFFYGLLTIIPVFLINKPQIDWSIFRQPLVWGNIAFLAIAASLVCYALWNVVIVKLGPVKATNYVYLNPVATMIGAAIFMDEHMTALSLAGSAMTLLGVWLANKATPDAF